MLDSILLDVTQHTSDRLDISPSICLDRSMNKENEMEKTVTLTLTQDEVKDIAKALGMMIRLEGDPIEAAYVRDGILHKIKNAN